MKTELLNAGVADWRMKVVSLGEEGVLCVDSSDVCRRMSRRVHLEFRKIGLEHMAAPAGATSSLELPAEEIDRTRKTGTADVPTENIVSLNPEPIAGS